jgi:hypothetical protein
MCLEPVVAARKVGPKIERHPWLLQSIDEYEHMDFSWERRCGNIDWDVYAAELHERVSAGFQVQRLFGLHQLCSTPTTAQTASKFLAAPSAAPQSNRSIQLHSDVIGAHQPPSYQEQ